MCLESKKDSVREADGLSAVNTSLTPLNVRCSIENVTVVQPHRFYARNKHDLHSDPQDILANDALDMKVASYHEMYAAIRRVGSLLFLQDATHLSFLFILFEHVPHDVTIVGHCRLILRNDSEERSQSATVLSSTENVEKSRNQVPT